MSTGASPSSMAPADAVVWHAERMRHYASELARAYDCRGFGREARFVARRIAEAIAGMPLPPPLPQSEYRDVELGIVKLSEDNARRIDALATEARSADA